MVLVIDNYDSFTYNLVQLLGGLGVELAVYRNDQVSPQQVAQLQPAHIVISPGPGRPTDGGASNEVISHFHKSIPILGVCLGHQCIAYVFGGRVVRARRLMHGKTSLIYHDGRGIFQGVPSPFEGMRYHSLIVEGPLPQGFEVSAYTLEGEIMGLRHRDYPLVGVQFHPESILTLEGKGIVKNFLNLGGKDD